MAEGLLDGTPWICSLMGLTFVVLVNLLTVYLTIGMFIVLFGVCTDFVAARPICVMRRLTMWPLLVQAKGAVRAIGLEKCLFPRPDI